MSKDIIGFLITPSKKRDWLVTKFRRFVVKGKRCWFWDGARHALGYGKLIIFGKAMLAHRVSWILSNKVDPRNLNVLHRCDNPCCVRPSHLFLGSHKENMADKKIKNRQAKGERGGNTKLTEKKVLSIRWRYANEKITQTELATEHGVTQGLIGHIVRRMIWKHV